MKYHKRYRKRQIQNSIEYLVYEFAIFLKSEYNIETNYQDILLSFIDYNLPNTKSVDETDIYFTSEENKLYKYFYKFFSTLDRIISYKVYSQIDKTKFIEYALIILITEKKIDL